MDYHIRPLEKRDYTLLPDFLYETIYVPKGRKKPSKKILNMPELRLYTHGFGQKASDFGFAAELEASCDWHGMGPHHERLFPYQ